MNVWAFLLRPGFWWRALVTADLLIVAWLGWLGVAVTAAFMGPGRFNSYDPAKLVRAGLLFGGGPLLGVLAVFAGARVLAGRRHGAGAMALLAAPVVLFAAWWTWLGWSG